MKKAITLFFGFIICIQSQALWSPLGSGLPARVRALCVHNGELYAGGDFNELIKKWDGTSWVSIGGGLSGTVSPKVNGLISFNGELYAGGSFNVAGSQSGNVAKFDGTNWVAVGDGLGGIAGSSVTCFYEWNGVLFAGGTFSQSGTSFLSKVAKLDTAGTSWHQVGGGAPSKCSAGVYAITAYYNELYVGGQGSAPWINKLDIGGNVWIDLPVGGMQTGVGVYALATFHYPSAISTSLFIGGDFTSPPSPTCCTYNNGSWGTSMTTFSSGVTDQVNAFLSTSDYIYAGGVFTSTGLNSSTNITKKSITAPWDSVGVLLNGLVDAFTIYNGFLVTGGDFITANGTTVNRVTINDGIFVSDNPFNESTINCNLYPNPSSDQITISIDQRQPGKKSIAFIDLFGKTIFQNEFSGIELKTDVSDLPKGIYFYVLKEDAILIKSGRFIVE